MEATITKSIGNTYLIQVDNKYYDLVKWKTASNKAKLPQVLRKVNEALKGIQININVNEKTKKALEKAEDEILSIKKYHWVDWIDKKRTFGAVISRGVSGRVIKVCPFKKLQVGLEELESPIVKYYFRIEGVLLDVPKVLFNSESGSVLIEEQRAW